MTYVANAEWTKVSKNLTGDTFYVDLERTKKHDGKVYFWQLADYFKPYKYGNISVGMMSFKTYVEAECGRFRFRNLSGTSYKGSMGTGTVITSANTPDKDWSYPSPNSAGEFKLKAVCNHKSMK